MNTPQSQYMASLMGQANSVGSQPATKRKPITVGMTVLDTSDRPYREGVVNKIASEYEGGETDYGAYALVGYDTFWGKRMEWVRVHALVPIGESK